MSIRFKTQYNCMTKNNNRKYMMTNSILFYCKCSAVTSLVW